MSASRMPTLSPRSRRPSARLTAVVDLPTPPLPEATAMMASTPGMPAGDCGACPGPACGRAAPGCICGRRGGALPPAPDARSPVSATNAEATPGTARTAASARSRTGSHCFTAAASTVMEKKTLPSVTTMSDRVPVAGSGLPSGLETLPSAARTSSFVGIITAPGTGPNGLQPHLHRPVTVAVNAVRSRTSTPVLT